MRTIWGQIINITDKKEFLQYTLDKHIIGIKNIKDVVVDKDRK